MHTYERKERVYDMDIYVKVVEMYLFYYCYVFVYICAGNMVRRKQAGCCNDHMYFMYFL